jgi:hypothetical protein
MHITKVGMLEHPINNGNYQNVTSIFLMFLQLLLCALHIKGNISYGLQGIRKLKNHVNKSMIGTHLAKVQANENTSRHDPKKKQTNNKNQIKMLCKEDS